MKSNLYKPSKNPKKNDIVVEVLAIDQVIKIQIKLHIMMIGHLLFRITLQVLKKERKGRIPWDDKIDSGLVEEWLSDF